MDTKKMILNKRLQIHISAPDKKIVQQAAKLYGISAAEWVRRVVRKAAARDLGASVILDPLDAVKNLSKLNAPVSSLKRMKEETIRGRFE